MSQGDQNQHLLVSRPAPVQWLALKDASEFLGVHFTTLRKWADSGEIRVFRTPGGHRRFSMADLRRFLEERAGQLAPTDADAFLNVAVGRVRAELEKMPHEQARWATQLDDDARDLRRQRGRQLFALAIAYVLKPAQRERLLAEGRRLGYEYGTEAAVSELGLMETGRAVQFFRSQLNQVLRSDESGPMLDADDVRVQQTIDYFLDEVLYAVLNGYEDHLAH
jgi:excisionase family DNA binding protein